MDGDGTIGGHGGRSKFFPENFTNVRVNMQVQRSYTFVHLIDVQLALVVRVVRFHVVIDFVGKPFKRKLIIIVNNNVL